VVPHQYSPLDDPTKTVTRVKVGETVRVKVTVIAPAERNYVIFVAPAHAEDTYFPEVFGRSDSGRFRVER
jgi:hypothetical protein